MTLHPAFDINNISQNKRNFFRVALIAEIQKTTESELNKHGKCEKQCRVVFTVVNNINKHSVTLAL